MSKIAIVKTVGGVVFPSHPLAATKEELQKIENRRLIKKDEDLGLIDKDLRSKEKELKLREEEQNRRDIDLKVREEEQNNKELK